MKLKNFEYLISLFIFLIIFSPLRSEEKIDIWNDNKKVSEERKDTKVNKKFNSTKIDNGQRIKPEDLIEIEDSSISNDQENKVYGVYDPAKYNFNLEMWSTTKAEDLRASLKRIKKINLSKTSEEILENVLLSFSYPPNGMSEEEFVKLKIDWLIINNKVDLIENFLKQNKNFSGKSEAVQYLVDMNIAQANIKQGCEKIEFIDSTIKDAYLEKFKIYCLVFNNKKSQAQLLLDLLREQKQSDKFLMIRLIFF